MIPPEAAAAASSGAREIAAASSAVVRSACSPAISRSFTNGPLSCVRLVSHLPVPPPLHGRTAAPFLHRHAAVPLSPVRLASMGARFRAHPPPRERDVARRTPGEDAAHVGRDGGPRPPRSPVEAQQTTSRGRVLRHDVHLRIGLDRPVSSFSRDPDGHVIAVRQVRVALSCARLHPRPLRAIRSVCEVFDG